MHTTTIEKYKDKDKYENVYFRYRQPLFRIAKAIVKDDFLAYDALQECFVKIFHNIDKINDLESPKTKAFLTTIVKHTAIDLYRKERRLESVTELTSDSLEFIEDDFSVEEILAREDTSKELKAHISKLSEIDRNIVTLKYFHERSDREISGILSLTEGNVRVRLNRARKRLAEFISGEGGVRGASI